MKREDLFLAIGAVDESRLARSELAVSGPSGACHKEEPIMKKKGISAGRIIRNILVAALILSMVSMTAYAAVGYLIFDSPSEMLTSIFGDKTGYDHKDVTHWTDPEKPGSVYDNPAYDRVPVDEAVVQSEAAPMVSPVGQSISWKGYTLTVDANMYDHVTKCGVLTYTIENPDGLKPYEVLSNGELSGDGLDTNQYGYSYIIQDKSSDIKLTAAYYYQLRNPNSTDLELTISQWVAVDPGPEYQQHIEQILEEIKQQYTAEEAIEAFIQEHGQEEYDRLSKEETQEQITEFGYGVLWTDKLNEMYTCPDKIIIPEAALGEMSSVVLADGNIVISPIAMYIDITDMQDYPVGYIGVAKIQFKDGTEYVVADDNTANYMFAVGSSEKEDVTYMFNRMIDVNEITSVILDSGLEFTVN